MAHTILLEICVDSLASAVAAERGGADRVELCSDMGSGGITPSFGLIRAVVRALRIPVMVLVRPRPGGFVHSREELAVMREDIGAARNLGAAGIVLGAVTRAGLPDRAALRPLLRAARGLDVTFHRAVDSLRDPAGALGILADLGVTRVLTSGGASSAFAGRGRIAALVEAAGDDIAVMAGGRVERRTLRRLVLDAGVGEVHVGGAVTVPVSGAVPDRTDASRAGERRAFGRTPGIVDPGKVAALRKTLRSIR